MNGDANLTVECRCGAEHVPDDGADRVHCEDCGATYAVTVTRL